MGIITDGDTREDCDDTNLAEVEEEGDKRDDRAGAVGGGQLVVEVGGTNSFLIQSVYLDDNNILIISIIQSLGYQKFVVNFIELIEADMS